MSKEEHSELIALLEQRAEVLKPNQELIDAAILRCERYQIAHGSSAAAVSDDSEQQAAATEQEQQDEAEQSLSADLSTARTIEENRLTEEQLEDHREVAKKHDPKKSKKRKLLKPGTEIQGYRILGLLGKGGMGQVYRALQISMNREVAFKVLSPRYAASKSFRTRFLREAQSAGRLHHRHLIAVHDVDETPEGMLFFSMELVEGKSIADMIDDDGPMDETESLRIIRQTLDALVYAHDRNIIHRDIKPDNIILNSEGAAKVADLGLSRIDEEGEKDGRVTAANTMMGTPYYMSPEQSRDAHTVDHRTDLYSVGATLYHMICGDVPFDGETPLDVVVAASTEKLEFIEPQPSPGVKRFINVMMAKEPEDRPQNAAEALVVLDRLVENPKASLSKTNGTKILVSIAIIVLIAMLIIMASMSNGNTQPTVDPVLEQGDHHGHEPVGLEESAELPRNVLEAFYYDMGKKVIHEEQVSVFDGSGHGTVRFASIAKDDELVHLRLRIQARQASDFNSMVFQFMLANQQGPRMRNGLPGLMISQRGIFFGKNNPIKDRIRERMDRGERDRRDERMKLADTNGNIVVDFIIDGQQLQILMHGEGGRSASLELNAQIESIDLRWNLNNEVRAELTRVDKASNQR